jgi:PAS domain S-box-containing protein
VEEDELNESGRIVRRFTSANEREIRESDWPLLWAAGSGDPSCYFLPVWRQSPSSQRPNDLPIGTASRRDRSSLPSMLSRPLSDRLASPSSATPDTSIAQASRAVAGMSVAALRVLATTLATCIFLFDTLAPLEGAVAVLYVLVILLAAATGRRGDILAAAAAGLVLTVVAYLAVHGSLLAGAPALRALVSLASITIASLLALKNQADTATLAAQARLLDLSHDMTFARDSQGRITFWNRAAEEVYGWRPAEAVGQIADELLKTEYALPRATINQTLHMTGRWDGVLVHWTRTGERIVVESRWALRRNVKGRIVGVLETNTDITEREAAHAALVQSERRYRHMFNASRIGLIEEDWSAVRAELVALGLEDRASLSRHLRDHPAFIATARKLARIVDVNPAFLAMVGVEGTEDFLRSVDDILSEGDTTFGSALAAFAQGDPFYEGETEVSGSDGSRIPVIFALTFPAPDDSDCKVMVFAVDATERRKAQDAALQAQAELAHAARVATLGEFTASIAHEVNQPLMAVVTSGEAALRWLRRSQPDLSEVDTALARVVSEGRRASEIVKRIRAFLTKTTPRSSEIGVAGLVEEATQLVQRELVREHVELRSEIDIGLPPIIGDRVQLQQVVVNLMVNARQAMVEHGGRRLLTLTASRASPSEVEIAVRDSGPGISSQDPERLFAPFFTTKPDGMGMGLAICRTIAEAHGGRLTAGSPPGGGAIFSLILPVSQQGVSA